MSNFDPITLRFDPPLVGRDLAPGETGRFEASKPLVRWNKKGILPRLGLAYRLTSKTVIRSGYGIYANEPPVGMVQALGSNPRPGAEGRTFLSDPRVPTLSLSNPFDPKVQVPGAAFPNVTGFENPLPQWLIHNWGLSIQHALTSNMLFEIGYQGSHSVHELQVTEFNDAVPGPGPRQQRRPFPQLQTYRLITANGDSRYNGLEIKLERRPGELGLSMLLAYTWAKTLDTIGGRLAIPGDPTGISRNLSVKDNRGLGEANIPGRFVLMTGYELPFGPGKQFLTDSVLGKILGGWSIYSILTLQKGPWFTPVIPSDRLDVGSTASSRPDLVGNPNLPVSERTPQRWFNTGAFALPPPFKYGNAGRSIIEGPGLGNLDLSLMRAFRISEDSRLEFRFEAFNLTNHTNFALPGNAFGTPSFGVIRKAFESRDLQFGLKFYF